MKYTVLLLLLIAAFSSQKRLRAELATMEDEQLIFASNYPQQIHVNIGSFDSTSVVVTFSSSGQISSPVVLYGTESNNLNLQATPLKVNQYNYNSGSDQYTSNYIYHSNLTSLTPGQTYYYRVGDSSDANQFSTVRNFTVPPAVGPEQPFTFALVGDVGQTSNSNETMQHIIADKDITVIVHAGDISYADGDQSRWDSYQILAEPLSSYRLTQFVGGNHEQEPDSSTSEKFIAYQNRFLMPSQASGSNGGNLYYSFEVASAHWIMLTVYTDFSQGSDFYNWFVQDLQSVDRKRTPWLFVVVHAPWYNSNSHHQNEKEEVNMKKLYEDFVNQYQVDMVFAGHVHSYERFYGVYQGQRNDSAPIYINIGDGGNREGLAIPWLSQPNYSAYREASYGHGKLQIFNSTHATWGWNRNQDNVNTMYDQVDIVKSVSNGKRQLQFFKNGQLETENRQDVSYKRPKASKDLTIQEIHRSYL